MNSRSAETGCLYAAVTLLIWSSLVIMMSGVPVVGVLLSVALLGENLSAEMAVGAAVTFLGAFIGAMAKPSVTAGTAPGAGRSISI